MLQTPQCNYAGHLLPVWRLLGLMGAVAANIWRAPGCRKVAQAMGNLCGLFKGTSDVGDEDALKINTEDTAKATRAAISLLVPNPHQ